MSVPERPKSPTDSYYYSKKLKEYKVEKSSSKLSNYKDEQSSHKFKPELKQPKIISRRAYRTNTFENPYLKKYNTHIFNQDFILKDTI